MTKVKALYTFESGGGEELGFQENEVLTVVRQDIGDGWWEASNSRGQQGLIPESYVEPYNEPESLPEPSMPPPPPPTTYLQQSNAPVSRPSSSWNSNQNQQSSWNQPAPAAATPKPWNASSAAAQQESGEDWYDDEWSDDDSSTTTETPSYQSDSMKESRTGTVRRIGRFSALNNKQGGGEQFLFGTSTTPVPESEKCQIIMKDENGPSWKSHIPFECQILSHKKESKFKGMKSFTAYQLTPSFSNIQVSRRYKHFDWLHERLLEKFSIVCVPNLPDKQISGRYEEDFITDRKNRLQLWLNRMCQHPVIATSDVFHHFLECTDDKRWKEGKRKAEKDEYQGLKFFLAVEAPKLPDNEKNVDEKIERFSRFIKSMDDSIKHMYAIGDHHAKKHQGSFRKDFLKLGSSFIALAKSFEFDERRESENLTGSIKNTGLIYERIGGLYEKQPENDMFPLLESLQEYKGILGTFPEVLSVRRSAYQKLEESFTRLSEEDIASAQSRLDVISAATLAEMNHFQQYRIGDFKKMIQLYLMQQIKFHEEITLNLKKTLELYDTA